MSLHQQHLLAKLAAAWKHTPTARLGQLIESVENVGWDIFERLPGQRVHAPRLCWMSDELMESALDEWCDHPARRKVVVA